MPPSDADLIHQVRLGNTEAFGVLVDRHSGRLGRYALHLLGNRADAEEAVQEALVRAFRSLARLSPEHREAIALRFGEDLSFAQMATVTGAGIPALKMRVRRACDRLRALRPSSPPRSPPALCWP